MKAEIEALLPRIQNNELSEQEINALLNRVREQIKLDPLMGKELGPMISVIKQAQSHVAANADLYFYPIAGGRLAMGHKPGGKLGYPLLKRVGVTVVLTLLQENEGAKQIGDAARAAGLNWIWFPFSASKPHDGAGLQMVTELYASAEKMLNADSGIYIHCSAGIHRTGMFTYGLLRYLGKSEDEARQILSQMREVTARQAGEERLTWGDQFARS